MCNLYHRSTAAPLLSSTACVVVPWWYTARTGIPAGPAVDGVYGVRGRTNERINVPRYRGIRRPTVGNASAHAGANPQGGQARHLGTGAVQAGTHTHNTQRSNCCCSTRTHTHTPTRNRGPAFPDRDATAASILLFPIVDLFLPSAVIQIEPTPGLTDCTSPTTTWQQVQRPADSVPLTHPSALVHSRYFLSSDLGAWSTILRGYPLPDQEPTSMYVPHLPLPHPPPAHITI